MDIKKNKIQILLGLIILISGICFFFGQDMIKLSFNLEPDYYFIRCYFGSIFITGLAGGIVFIVHMVRKKFN